MPVANNQELYLLYLFYSSYEKVILYKPKLNYQSQEYYLIGLNYKTIDDRILDKLIDFLKDYKLVGLSDKIPNDFLAQIDKAQHTLLDNFNKFIRKKIYFADNLTSLTDEDWKEINKASKNKIIEWLERVPVKKLGRVSAF